MKETQVCARSSQTCITALKIHRVSFYSPSPFRYGVRNTSQSSGPVFLERETRRSTQQIQEKAIKGNHGNTRQPQSSKLQTPRRRKQQAEERSSFSRNESRVPDGWKQSSNMFLMQPLNRGNQIKKGTNHSVLTACSVHYSNAKAKQKYCSSPGTSAQQHCGLLFFHTSVIMQCPGA